MAWIDELNPQNWTWEDAAKATGVGAIAPWALSVPGISAIAGGGLSDNAGNFFSPGTQTTTKAPWGPQQSYLLKGFEEAQNLYNQGAPLTPEMSDLTQQYLTGLPGQIQGAQQTLSGTQGILSDIAGGGLSPLAGPAGQYLTDVTQGKYLGSNPYLEQMYQQGAQDISRSFREGTVPGIMSAFGGSAGAFGSGAHQAALQGAERGLGESLGKLYTGIYNPNYQFERGLQQQGATNLGDLGISDINTRLAATGQVPALTGTGIDIYNQLGRGGTYQDIYNQTRAMDPWTSLGLYNQNIRGQYGGTATGPGPSPFERYLNIGSNVSNIAAPFFMQSPGGYNPGGYNYNAPYRTTF